MLEVKVWWDTSLTIGDDFRNEIMTELGRARAVIVIWTDASIKSDWVRSEAGRAQADRKLIPVKLEHLTYKDLPPPFDVLHTENVDEDDKIRAAVVAKLAKPGVEPTAGEDTRSLAHYLGHRNLQSTARYTALVSDRFGKILEGLDCESPWRLRDTEDQGSRGPLLPQRFSPDPR